MISLSGSEEQSSPGDKQTSSMDDLTITMVASMKRRVVNNFIA